MGVGPALFNRTYSWNAHHRVTQPIAAPNQNSEWLQLFRGNIFGEIGAALVTNEKKIRAWRFPTVMQPKAVLRRGTRLFLEHRVRFRGDLFDRITWRIDSIVERHSPSAGSVGVNGCSEHGGTGPFRQKRRQRSGRCEFSKERN